MCLCIAVLGAITVAADTSDTSVRAPKKVISIAFDDSGSMEGDRWVYATYALQALVAQLNNNDELYITRMGTENNHPPDPSGQKRGRHTKADKIDITSNQSIESQLKEIQQWQCGNGTPLMTVDTAMKQLKSIKDDEKSTQYWLLILTDGVFQYDLSDDSTTLASADSLYKYLADNKIVCDNGREITNHGFTQILGSEMANGSTVNVAYIALGPPDPFYPIVDLTQHSAATQREDLHPFFAKDEPSIITTMGDVSAMISGRLKIDKIEQVDDKTISFSSPLPMYSFSILSQNSKAKVVTVSNGEKEFNIDRNLGLYAHDTGRYNPYGAVTLVKTTLSGNVTVVNNEASGNLSPLPKATYTVTFDDKVSAKNMLVQYEPAIGIHLQISKRGVVIEDLDKLVDGEKIDITIIPVIAGSDEVIPDSDIPKGTTWRIEHELEGNSEKELDDRTLTDVTVHKGENVINGYMTLPGYAPLLNSRAFTVSKLDLGIETENDKDLSYTRGELGSIGDEKKPRLYVTNEGERMTREQIEDSNVQLRVESISCEKKQYDGFLGFLTGFSNTDPTIRLQQNEDGSFSLVPDSPFWFTSFLVKPGDYTVEVVTEPDGGKTIVHFSLEASLSDWLNLFILLIIFLILLYLIYIAFIKYKFPVATIQADMYRLDRSTGRGVQTPAQAPDPLQLRPLKGHLFAPTRACSLTYNGLKIVAGPYGTVSITGRSIANTVAGYNKTTTSPTRGLAGIRKQMTPTTKKDGKQEASDVALDATPTYFIDDLNDIEIWSIWLE